MISSSNSNVTAEVRASTNKTLVLNVSHEGNGTLADPSFSGTMTFQLFNDLTPDVVARIEAFVTSGYYNNVIFHRIINGFVAQGGDPLGTGTGGPGTTFDDQFNVKLQHTVSGLLSMAKTSNDDTNGSQFFITDGSPRHLDFNHSIFGMITSG